MKKLLIIVLLAVVTAAEAQQLQEVVYLKNGSIIRGTIIEQVPNKSLKIKTADGSVFAYPMDEVEKITKEEYATSYWDESTRQPKPKKERVAPKHYPIQVGIRAGMNFPNLHTSYYGAKSDASGNGTQLGYHVGVIVDIPLYRNYFYIQPSMYLTQKGHKDITSDSSSKVVGYYNYYTETSNPTYLEFPILLSVRYTFDFMQVQVNFGPYLACGLFGNIKETEGTSTYKTSYFGDDGYMSRFDLGLSFGAGFLFLKHYYIGFQYELGLFNTIGARHPNISGLWNRRNWMLSLGYNF